MLLRTVEHITCKGNFFHFVLQAATKKQKYEKISEKKMSTPVEVLCKVKVQVFTFKCGNQQDPSEILLFTVLEYIEQPYR